MSPSPSLSAGPDSLLSMLAAASCCHDQGLRLLDRRERAHFLPWSELWRRAQGVAAGLVAAGVAPEDRVALVYPTCAGFFDALFGCLLAGATPVPLYPPVRFGRMEVYHQRSAQMLRDCGASLVLADAKVRRVLGPTIAAARPRLGCLTLSQLPAGPFAPRPAATLGLVQFSSGTTGRPKPVALSQAAILAQTDAILGAVTGQQEHPHAGVSWLPLYHDMGLIGCVFPALRQQTSLTLLGPETFIGRPASWLRALSRYGGTVSPAPNFAYALCVERISDDQLQGVDLSAWHYALNGAEPVAAEVLEAFQARFAAWGLRASALTPVYGLSEAALAVTFSEPDAPFHVQRLSRVALAEGRAEPDPAGVALVSVGRPLPGFELQLRRGDELVADGLIGRVWVRGPSLFEGYLGQPEASAACLVDGWLDTGDLGFVQQGALTLTGRAKDVLILRGRNYAPQLLEQAVDGLAGVRSGCAAAVCYQPEGAATAALWLLVELRKGAAPDGVAAACEAAVLAATGLRCEHVLLLAPGTLPRTSSGKIRRQQALRQLLEGELVPPAQVGPLSLAALLLRSALVMPR